MENKKIKIICPLTCTKCGISCFKYFDNCKYKNAASLKAINSLIFKSQQNKEN